MERKWEHTHTSTITDLNDFIELKLSEGGATVFAVLTSVIQLEGCVRNGRSKERVRVVSN